MGRTPLVDRKTEDQIKELKEKLRELGVDSAEVTLDGRGGLIPSVPIVHSFTVSQRAIENVAQADPGNIQQVAASQLEITNRYYQSVLVQAQQSFRSALAAAGIGLTFFLAAIAFLLVGRQDDVSVISMLSGALVEVIAGINFWLYGRTTKQLDAYHARLERTQRFLLANSMAENLDDQTKQRARAELVGLIAYSDLARPPQRDPDRVSAL
jgi:hypothetical protein